MIEISLYKNFLGYSDSDPIQTRKEAWQKKQKNQIIGDVSRSHSKDTNQLFCISVSVPLQSTLEPKSRQRIKNGKYQLIKSMLKLINILSVAYYTHKRNFIYLLVIFQDAHNACMNGHSLILHAIPESRGKLITLEYTFFTHCQSCSNQRRTLSSKKCKAKKKEKFQFVSIVINKKSKWWFIDFFHWLFSICHVRMTGQERIWF